MGFKKNNHFSNDFFLVLKVELVEGSRTSQ